MAQHLSLKIFYFELESKNGQILIKSKLDIEPSIDQKSNNDSMKEKQNKNKPKTPIYTHGMKHTQNKTLKDKPLSQHKFCSFSFWVHKLVSQLICYPTS